MGEGSVGEGSVEEGVGAGEEGREWRGGGWERKVLSSY